MKRHKTNTDGYFICAITLGVVAYYTGHVNMYIWLFLLIIRLLSFNRDEAGFFLLLFGSSMFGRIFVSSSLYLWSMIFSIVVGGILIRKKIFWVIKKNFNSFFFLSVLLLFFFLEYVVGPQTDYAQDKITRIFVRAPIWTTIFLVYVYNMKIDNKSMAVAFSLLAMFYISQSAEVYDIRPSSIADISFFRVQAELLERSANDTLVVNWQTLGFLSFAPILFLLVEPKITTKRKYLFLATIMSLFVILAGARQVIMCMIILCLLRFYLGKKTIFSLPNIIMAIAIIALFYLILTIAESTIIASLIGGDGDASTRLNRDTDTPFKIMEINPLLGVGFGGYPLYADKDYPHNFIIEVICETGYVGLLFLVAITFLFVLTNRNKEYFRYQTYGGNFMFLFLVFRLLVALISGDAGTSISFFCVLFTFISQKKNGSMPNQVGNQCVGAMSKYGLDFVHTACTNCT